jgi:hypothetical protein
MTRLFRLSFLLFTFAFCGLAQAPGGLFGGSGSVTALAVAPNGYAPFASGAASVIVPHSFGTADFSPMEVQCWTGAGVGSWTLMSSGWTVSSVGATSVTVAFSPTAPAAGACKVNFAGGVGPAGPAGPAGPTGATGPQGPAATWGAITGTFSAQTDLATALAGKASTTHTHAAADTTSGVFSPARLGTGTANSSMVLYGDGTWKLAPTGGSGAATNGTNGQFLTSNGAGGFGTPITANTGGNGQIITSNGSGGFGTPINPSQFANASHTHAATDIVSGTLPMTRIGTSGTRDNTTVIYGDGVWRTPPTSGGVTLPNTTAILKGNNTGGAVAAVAGTDYQAPLSGTCSTGQHVSSVNASTGAVTCTADTGASGTPSGRFTLSTTSNSATLSCASCAVQKGDGTALVLTGVNASFTVPASNANNYTALYCLDGNVIDLVYNGTATISTFSGLTPIAGQVTCPAGTTTLYGVTVVNAAVTGTVTIDPNYYQQTTYSFPGALVTGTNAKTVTYNLARKIGGPFSPGTGTSGVLVDADLTWTGFFVNDATPKTMTEANCYSDTGNQTITVSVGALTAFTLTCVPKASYVADGLGTHGHIDLVHMTNATIASNQAAGGNFDLSQSGTANGSTHSVQLTVFAQ